MDLLAAAKFVVTKTFKKPEGPDAVYFEKADPADQRDPFPRPPGTRMNLTEDPPPPHPPPSPAEFVGTEEEARERALKPKLEAKPKNAENREPEVKYKVSPEIKKVAARSKDAADSKSGNNNSLVVAQESAIVN